MASHKCSKPVLSGPPYRRLRSSCRLPGTIEEDGQWWCHHHSPTAMYVREVKAARDRARERYVFLKVADAIRRLQGRWLVEDMDNNAADLVGMDEVAMRRKIMNEIADFLELPLVASYSIRKYVQKMTAKKRPRSKSRRGYKGEGE